MWSNKNLSISTDVELNTFFDIPYHHKNIIYTDVLLDIDINTNVSISMQSQEHSKYEHSSAINIKHRTCKSDDTKIN